MPKSDFQTAPSAPPGPPIPPLPAIPGAGTGGQVTVTTVQTTGAAGADAQQQAIQNAIQAAQDAANAQAGQAGTTAPPQVYRSNPDIPPEIVPIIGIVFGSIAFMVVVSPIVRGIMKFIERRQDRQMVHGPSVANQLLQLQQSVDALAIEVERISESQRFQSKLMAEREKNALPSGKGGA